MIKERERRKRVKTAVGDVEKKEKGGRSRGKRPKKEMESKKKRLEHFGDGKRRLENTREVAKLKINSATKGRHELSESLKIKRE